jgi:hypothetical protein
MIVVIKDTKTEFLAKSFPKMMKTDDGLLVYFLKPNKGYVIEDGSSMSWSYGQESDKWCMAGFTDFEGVVELRNDWVKPI